jgi:hypothetical protein
VTELTETPFSPEAPELFLKPQVPMAIPKEIKDLALSKQLPPGNVGYIDILEPDSIRLISQQDWRPVSPRGIDKRLSVEGNKGREFPAIILHTPSRTPDNSYDEEIARLAELLRRTSSREEGIIIQQRLGTLFVVEDRGEDERVGWRENQMRNHGLVVQKEKGERSVRVSSDYVISQGRRHKQRSAVDLTKGRISGNMFDHFTDQIEESAAEQGLIADTSNLKREAKATRFVPRTLDNLREGGNVTYVGQGESGATTFERTKKGTDLVTPNREQAPNFQRAKKEEPKEVSHKPGDDVVLDVSCGECGQHYHDVYKQEIGDKRFILRKDTVCNGPHEDGYPKYRGRNIWVQALGLLPPSLRQKSPAGKNR